MYLGNIPATSFETVRKQISTSNSGTTITLDVAVSSVQDILVTVDAVIQSYDNYSVSGTTLTLGGTLNNNRVEILYVGRTFQTVSFDDASVTREKLNLISDGSNPSLIAKGTSGVSDGYIQLNCAENSHGVKIKSPPHSAGQSYTLTLPQSITNNTFLKTDGSGNLSFAGLGNYVIEKIDQYSYGTVVTSSTPANYLDIAGGNTINFTPRSTSDIIFITGLNLLSMGSASDGAGIGIMRATSSSITSSDTVVQRTGRHAVHHVGATSNYHIGKIITADTGLSASTTVYYEMFGQLHGSNGVRHFNSSVSNDKESTRHKLIGIHYKYIG